MTAPSAGPGGLADPARRLAPDAAIDLQLHTTLSDGTWTLEGLFDHLRRARFGLVAVTDHDRPDTAAEVHRHAAAAGVPVVTAVEMTTTWRGQMIDLLCYGFDPAGGALTDLARDLWRRQRAVVDAVVATARDRGGPLPAARVAEVLTQPSARQPHALTALLVAHGQARDAVAAGRLVAAAGGFATHDPVAVASAAHRSGAVCLLAHPGRHGFDERMLDAFRAEVPIDGFEVDHPAHAPARAAAYARYAERHGLLTSAGSDSHGPDRPPVRYRAGAHRALLERLGIAVR